MEVKEDLLQFIWRYRLFLHPLKDQDELEVELVNPGQHNRDAGPDFFNARIRSEGILWAGNIEIHKKASDWYLHNHHLDPAFDNVILHVVLEADCIVKNSGGREIRTARMEIAAEIFRRYGLLMNNPELIPCWRNLKNVNQSRFDMWLERLLIERLEDRVKRIFDMLDSCDGDWNEVLYRSLARAFGQKVNSDPFEMLARSVSLKTILNQCPDQLSKEAILFGQAGMLIKYPDIDKGRSEELTGESPEDLTGESAEDLTEELAGELAGEEYYAELCFRYQELKSRIDRNREIEHSDNIDLLDGQDQVANSDRTDKIENPGSFGLQPINGFLWKFLRLRPDNFPTIRISQLACSLEKYPDLFGQLVAAEDPLEFVMKMEIRASEYWTTHYRFGRMSPEREKRMGKNRMRGLFINAFLPVLFAYHRMDGKSLDHIDIQGLMTRMPAEDNRVIRMWKSLGREVPDVICSQALLQLTHKYCKFRRCLHCYIGSQIIHSSHGKNHK